MRNVCLTMRHKKGILESDIAKAQLKAQKNYSIRDLNYIYPFFSSFFFLPFPAIFLPWLPQDTSDDNASENL